jgi:3-oxoacyl-[acyl-carrier-protein] synthase-3
MATTRIEGVRLAGIAAAVPDSIVTLEDDARVFGAEDARRIFKNTGVKSRHVTRNGMCTSDFCLAAATRLLDDLGWERDSVDALVFVTQGPDYFAPASACVLQRRLGLGTGCAAFDVNLGCSGYVYGLWLVSSLFSGGGFRRALLLVGDTASRTSSPMDRAVVPLFGDAGAATALEADASSPPMHFILGTDGRGAPHLILPAGAFRKPHSEETARMCTAADGNIRSEEHTYMNGAEVFTFTLTHVPSLIKDIKSAAGWTNDDVDGFVFHQASTFMLKNLARASGLPSEKMVIGMEQYGNTSSASIPLAICDQLRASVTGERRRLVLAGYGIGWSWGAAAVNVGPIVVPPVIVVPDVAPVDPF